MLRMRSSMSDKRTFILAVVSLILIIAFVIWKIMPTLNERKASEAAAKWGRLAPIPGSATQVRAKKHDTLTWSEIYVSFHASPAAINRFIASSPGLKDIQPELLSSKHMYLRNPSNPASADLDSRYIYFDNDAVFCGAGWYDPTIRSRGRLFKLPYSSDLQSGEVVVDDVRNVVYIHEDLE